MWLFYISFGPFRPFGPCFGVTKTIKQSQQLHMVEHSVRIIGKYIIYGFTCDHVAYFGYTGISHIKSMKC